MTQAFTTALMEARDRAAVFATLHTYSQSIMPVRLWTVMEVDMAAGVARRAYSSAPKAYPTSGTKPIPDNDWFTAIHERRETFVANDINAIAAVFPDHETIAALGCASVVNLPVFLGAALAGTINLLDGEGAFGAKAVARLEDCLTLPALAALAVARGFG